MIEQAVFENYGNGSSVTFNTDTIPFHNFITYEEYRTEEREKMQAHGLWPSYTYLGKRVWQVEGSILNQTAADFVTTRRNIKKVLMPAPHLGYLSIGKLRITFTGMEEVYSDCTVDGYELPVEALFPSAGEFMITWKAFDPRCYSQTEYSQTIGTPNTTAGRTYNKTYAKSYAAMVGTNNVVVANAGEISSLPDIDIYGPVQRPQLILTRGGTDYSFTLGDLGIDAGDRAVISFKNRTVTSFLTGANWYHYAHDAIWWELEPGNNTISFEAAEAISPAKAVIKWRNAYMP